MKTSKIIKVYKNDSSTNKDVDNYIPVINSNTIIKGTKQRNEVSDLDFLRKSNYLSEFKTSGEKAEVRKNLNIKDTSYLVDPENHPYSENTSVKKALDTLFESYKKALDSNNIIYNDITVFEALQDLYNLSKDGIDLTKHKYTYNIGTLLIDTNAKSFLDLLYKKVLESFNPENHPYTNKKSTEVSNVKQALDDLYSGSGSSNDPKDHPYTNAKNTNVTNVWEALNDLYSKNISESLDLTAENVKYQYNGREFKNVKEALDSILYVKLSIVNFYALPNEAEVGSVLPEVTFYWNYNKDTILKLLINNVQLDVTDRQKKEFGITNSVTKTLIASDGITLISKNAYVTFKLGKYYGTSNILPTSQNIINNFTRNLNLSKGSEITVDAKEGEYIYIMVPLSMSDIRFFVGGFEGGFHVKNPHYIFERYGKLFDNILFESDNPSLGKTIIKIT